MSKTYKKEKNTYPNIDMQATGRRMKHLLSTAGYTPRMIQEYLHLSCVQPIYRWYKGLILPSVDHLFMLSELLDVHMEELLVKKNKLSFTCDVERWNQQSACGRYMTYYNRICKIVA